MKICGIYKLTSPSGKIYIGQSKDIKNRFSDHKRSVSTARKNKCPKLYCAIKKYGWDSFKKEIVGEYRVEELDQKEIYWIKYFDSYKFGYNCNEGGSVNRNLSDETKQKLRQASLGKYHGSQNICFYINNVMYNSIGDASKALKIPIKTIHNRLNSKNIKFANYCYRDKSKVPERRKAAYKNKPFYAEGVLFNTLSSASEDLSLSIRAIGNRIKSKNFPSYFYVDSEKASSVCLNG